MTQNANTLALTPADRAALIARGDLGLPSPKPAAARPRPVHLTDEEMAIIVAHRERRAARQPRFIISPA